MFGVTCTDNNKEELLYRPCIKEGCKSPSTHRSTQYGVAFCSDQCKSAYSFQKCSDSLSTLFLVHGSLLKQAFVEYASNRFSDIPYKNILKELDAVDSRIAKIVEERSGKDVAALLHKHVEIIMDEELQRPMNGVDIIAYLFPGREEEEIYKSMITHMTKYQGAIKGQHLFIQLGMNFHGTVDVVSEQLKLLAECIYKALPKKEPVVKPTFSFMLNHMNGRVPKGGFQSYFDST